MHSSIWNFINQYVSFNTIHWNDLLDVIILSFLLYEIMVWIKKTRAWVLLKGFAVLLVFIFVAWAFRLNTILWLGKNIFSLGITALVIVFQPELRKALEQLGRQNIISSVFNFDSSKETEARFSDKTVNELVKAVFEMAKVKTGALIVIEKKTPLNEYERTGITLDSVITSQLLINIFEKNTPLHDGAVIIRGDRIVSATCYLPLSDNLFLSKELGTRHRAAVGISEVTDSLTIVVSEETGAVSVAMEGDIKRNLTQDDLRAQLVAAQDKAQDTGRFRLWKGRVKKHEENADK
ncbi:diadenylate cyclase CdaA [Laedolimicola ammoniilytica]|uniref:Diadenylate cyclase n=1 Tax=Laedolimicola ammoniilytica TaxID=2981771 RepID=A0ABT2RZF5_9FIRM|nr:diadenylate cyclase CdaA [Laedolimicola ammoniilytica]MCU6697663.1 diadenylate cyclase CdaA [Laedolimicola ammoniilytica]SCH07603.1 DNA integrity scanning protein DisA [uncultured Clostridium sp.]SCI39297.1 DNA integrity scanning protein DisA [uncultured Clostridium sp.]